MPKTFRVPAPSSSPYLCTDIQLGQLPPFLERAVLVASEPQQQDMLLLSTLTACSYALPHIKMLHGIDQHAYYPNLMTLIIAPPASGKGMMKYAGRLLDPIHNALKAKGKLAFIPANSSSASFIDILKACSGQGFMMDTEMDILAKIWKKDYGDYSDLFRQAFEHETFSKARRMGTRSTKSIVIDEPRLSVLLSGTPSQVTPLLGTGEDGLASRFLPYIISDVMPFDPNVLLNGDHYTGNAATKVFDELAAELFTRWQWLSSQDHDCLWSFTDEQAQLLGGLLEDAENLAFEQVRTSDKGEAPLMPISFKHSFNRMVVTLKRIGLILTALRLDIPESFSVPAPARAPKDSRSGLQKLVDKVFRRDDPASSSNSDHPHTAHIADATASEGKTSSNLPDVLYCSDDDFRLLILFAEKLLRHAAQLVLLLPQSKSPLPLNRLERPKKMGTDDLLHQLPVKFTIKDAYLVGEQFGISQRTVKSRLQEACNDKKIIRTSTGRYRKL